MSIPVLQIIIKQWDKGQQTEADVRQRAAVPDRYAIAFPPAIYAFDRSCIIDRHGCERLDGRVRYAKPSEDTVVIDRFKIDLNEKQLFYTTGSGDPAQPLSSLYNQWAQCRYQWRYSVCENGMIYWLYEEVMLNAIIVPDINPNIFLTTEPAIVHDNLDAPSLPGK